MHQFNINVFTFAWAFHRCAPVRNCQQVGFVHNLKIRDVHEYKIWGCKLNIFENESLGFSVYRAPKR